MKRLALTTALIAAVHAASGCFPFVNRENVVRVLVFNIHAGKDSGGRDNLADVAALVKSTGADLVLLQEVDRGTNRSGKVDQLQALIDATGYAGVFGRTLDYDGGQYGIAALARRGFTFSDTRHLPVLPVQSRAGGSHEPRGVLLGASQTALGRLQFFNTHLDASGADEYRLQEVSQLLLHVRARMAPETPLVAGGDFNAEPGSAVIKRMLDAGLRDAWTECGTGDGFTYPAAQPVKRIDYLFLPTGVSCTDAAVLDSTASDHRPLLVTIRMAGGQ